MLEILISALEIPISWLPNSPYEALILRVSNTELSNQSSLLNNQNILAEGKTASAVAWANLEVSSFLTVAVAPILLYVQLAVANKEDIELELAPALPITGTPDPLLNK